VSLNVLKSLCKVWKQISQLCSFSCSINSKGPILINLCFTRWHFEYNKLLAYVEECHQAEKQTAMSGNFQPTEATADLTVVQDNIRTYSINPLATKWVTYHTKRPPSGMADEMLQEHCCCLSARYLPATFFRCSCCC